MRTLVAIDKNIVLLAQNTYECSEIFNENDLSHSKYTGSPPILDTLFTLQNAKDIKKCVNSNFFALRT